MNVCVIATAARESGALSIYLQFIHQLKQDVGNDKYLIIIDPSMPREEIPGVTYIGHATPRFERVACDFFKFRRIIKQQGFVPDVVLSFQNSGIRFSGARQIIYFHNPLPLTDKQWNFLKSKQERKLFFYKNIYYYYIRTLLQKNGRIVVQAHFLKKAFARKFHFPESQIYVLKPTFNDIGNLKDISPYPFEESGTYNFIYPAVEHLYKNHILLAEALNELKKAEAPLVEKIRIHLTIQPEQNPSFYRYIQEKGLLKQFVFHGKVQQQQLFQMYKGSIALLFPSYIETVGLPQIEAAAFGLPVVDSDLEFAHEALQGYEGVTYLSHTDPQQWAHAIKSLCQSPKHFQPWHAKTENSWHKMFDIIHS
jgi:glycosyltransferase involved in cell wall biosynthesis